MKIVKTLCSSLVAGVVLLFLAPEASAQRLVASTPSYHHARSGPVVRRVWVPGRYETVYERLWIPARCERIWVEPVYDWRLGSCGLRFSVLASAGHWKSVSTPGHFETRGVRIYRPGHWAFGNCG